jgi:hypothetical protein
MELTISERRAVTKVLAKEYRHASRARKGEILDQICAVTGGILIMPQGAGSGPDHQGRAASPAEAAGLWWLRHRRAAVLLGRARHAVWAAAGGPACSGPASALVRGASDRRRDGGARTGPNWIRGAGPGHRFGQRVRVHQLGLFPWCEQEKLTFTRSPSGNKNDGSNSSSRSATARRPRASTTHLPRHTSDFWPIRARSAKRSRPDSPGKTSR